MKWRALASAAVCLGGLLALRLWVLEPIMVGSDSMEPTVSAGSFVWLDKASPGLTGVHPGQLVVFRGPDDAEMPNNVVLLKRVVAEGGQTVSMWDGQLYVDGKPAQEPFVDQRTIDGVYFGTVTVPEANYAYSGTTGKPPSTRVDSAQSLPPRSWALRGRADER